MKMRDAALFLFLLAFAVFTTTYRGNAQRAPRGKVQAVEATSDKAGPHPGTATISGSVKITCMNAVSETPNSRPAPSCHVTAPGFTGNLDKRQSKEVTGNGAVTLKCNGQGYLRCNIRIDIPPPSK
ncbi:MAG: hypothetical protein ACRD59_15650 [Candidatus Acidiferrales bacterium]